MSFLWLSVGALVVWRVTHLIQAEDGPWNVIVHLRRIVGESMLGSLMDCFHCLSLWVAAPVAYAIGSGCKERLWLWPALSGAAILLERFTDRSQPVMLPEQSVGSQSVLLRQEQSSSSSQCEGISPNNDDNATETTG